MIVFDSEIVANVEISANFGTSDGVSQGDLKSPIDKAEKACLNQILVTDLRREF